LCFGFLRFGWLAVVTCQCPGGASYALHMAGPVGALYVQLLYGSTLYGVNLLLTSVGRNTMTEDGRAHG
jgi:hypothetical protein